MESVNRFFRPSLGSFFLFGPRGTGKSTWLRAQYPDALTIDLLRPELLRRFEARPERLRELVAAWPASRIIIDEIQRVPALLSVVHGLIEEHPNLRFVLTGSSARKIRRDGVDLLAGRAVLRSMHPFMAAELGAAFSLDHALDLGMVPLVRSAQDPSDVLSTYASLYVDQEVRSEGMVRNIGAFARFLEAAAMAHATPLNVANVARDCECERKTVAGYFSILEDLLLSFQLPVFTRRAKRALAARSKFYLFDAGVFRSLRPTGPLDAGSEIDGAALEGLVVQHLRAWNAYRGNKNRLYYWRTRAGVEVDLVLYGDDGLWAIEVKNTAVIRPADLYALRSFNQDYPESRLLMLYRGEERLRRSGVLCLPCADFLRDLTPDRALLSEQAGATHPRHQEDLR